MLVPSALVTRDSQGVCMAAFCELHEKGLTFSSRVTKICNRVAVALTLEANNQIQRDFATWLEPGGKFPPKSN